MNPIDSPTCCSLLHFQVLWMIGRQLDLDFCHALFRQRVGGCCFLNMINLVSLGRFGGVPSFVVSGNSRTADYRYDCKIARTKYWDVAAERNIRSAQDVPSRMEVASGNTGPSTANHIREAMLLKLTPWFIAPLEMYVLVIIVWDLLFCLWIRDGLIFWSLLKSFRVSDVARQPNLLRFEPRNLFQLRNRWILGYSDVDHICIGGNNKIW